MTRDPTWTLPQAPADPRARAASIVVATAVHLGLIVLMLSMKSPPVARSGPPGWAFSFSQPDEGGGGGGGGAPMLQLPAEPPPVNMPALPAVVPSIDAVVPQVDIPVLTDPSTIALAAPPDTLPSYGSVASGGAGGGAGTGSGTGAGTGTGAGSGSGTGSGRGAGSGGDGIRPPAPLTILIPPAATASVRGKHATVRLQVDSVGVVRDADVVVSSGDRGYDEKLRRIALGWRFRPARDGANRPVPYPFEVSLRF